MQVHLLSLIGVLKTDEQIAPVFIEKLSEHELLQLNEKVANDATS